MYLNIKFNGTKQWVFRFYWEGTQKRISFGVYSDVVLKKARSLPQQAQNLIASSIDPRTGRKNIKICQQSVAKRWSDPRIISTSRFN
ncbi:Arm DNA-binding domain-containing protein [Gilliamella apis]|uniref:Arm DNA-binding domain-containing protein n=1 Tax=Gilliamella apis TaxID=1970738 RepID=UPI0009BF473D